MSEPFQCPACKRIQDVTEGYCPWCLRGDMPSTTASKSASSDDGLYTVIRITSYAEPYGEPVRERDFRIAAYATFEQFEALKLFFMGSMRNIKVVE